MPVAVLCAPWARRKAHAVIAWEDAPRTLPHAYTHGLCPECAAGDHDQHYGNEQCAASGCTCEGVSD